MSAIARFLRDERGQTAIEYGLIVMVGAVAIIGSLQYFGDEVTGMFERALAGFARGGNDGGEGGGQG